MSWLSQDNEEAFAIALHPEKSYFSRIEALNTAGDTVLVEFDDGIVVRWFNSERIQDYLRITIGTDEQMDGLMDELRMIVYGE